MQQGRPSTSPQPVITPSAGASLPSIARWAKCGPAVDAELDEGARVDEQVDPLAGGELAALVLLAIFSSPPPSFAFSRRSCRSSTKCFMPVCSPCSVPAGASAASPACSVVSVLGSVIVPSTAVRASRRTR